MRFPVNLKSIPGLLYLQLLLVLLLLLGWTLAGKPLIDRWLAARQEALEQEKERLRAEYQLEEEARKRVWELGGSPGPGHPVNRVTLGLRYGKGPKDEDLECLTPFKHLAQLEINAEYLTRAGWGRLTGLRELWYLVLFMATDKNLDGLEELTSIRHLVIRGIPSKTPVGDEGLRTIGKMAGLEQLELYQAAVTDAGLEHLRGLPKLTLLYLIDTQASDAGVAALKAAMPDLTVVHYSTWEPESDED